jgi:hypothetical protein
VRARRGLRIVGAALAAGMLAALVTALVSRGLMWSLAAGAAERHGEVTHDNAVVGQRTLSGTLGLLLQAQFFAIPGTIAYVALRRFLPGRPALKGLLFGVLLLLFFGDSVLDGSYEYFRYASARVTVPMFAALFPLYGVVAVVLTERWAGTPASRRYPWVTRSGQGALVVLAIAGAAHLRTTLSTVYHLF